MLVEGATGKSDIKDVRYLDFWQLSAKQLKIVKKFKYLIPFIHIWFACTTLNVPAYISCKQTPYLKEN